MSSKGVNRGVSHLKKVDPLKEIIDFLLIIEFIKLGIELKLITTSDDLSSYTIFIIDVKVAKKFRDHRSP